MGNFSSKTHKKKKGPAITDLDRTILSLKTQKKKLEDQEKLISKRQEHHVEVARQLAGEGHRDRALLVLKKKKLGEKQMEQLHAHILNVENMLLNIETTKNQGNVFALLQQGNDALKQLQSQVRIEDVQKLMEETAEAAAYQQELAAVLGEQLTEQDDEQVEAELAALEEVVLDEERLVMPTAPKVPEAAAQKAPKQAEGSPAASSREQAQDKAAEEQPQKAEPLAAT